VLRTARDAIVSIDGAGHITLFNPMAEEIFGYRAEDVLGANVSVLMPRPYSDEHDRYIENYRRTGAAKAIGRVREVHGKRKNGEVFPIELSVSEAKVGDQVIHSAIIRDVTARHAIEEALRRERDFAQRLVDTAQVIVLVLDLEGRIVLFNRFMEELSGYRLDEVEGKDWFTTFLSERDRRDTRGVFADAVAGTTIRGNVNPIVTKSGEEHEIAWYSNSLLDAEKKAIGVLSVGQDISDRMRKEAELRTLQHLARQRHRLADIGVITAKVVHDVGNPLAALSMQAQLLLRRARRGDFMATELVEQPVQQMLSTLHRLETLVREFTTFAREQQLALKECELPTFLYDLIDSWRELTAAQGIDLTLDLDRPLPVVHADNEQLRRVFDNLIMNALDAIGKGPGRIRIHASPSDGGPDGPSVRIAVSDSGCGIPDDIDPFRLFETTKSEGTGLGLAIAKQIVGAHGGTIGYRAGSPSGTTFYIDLPIGKPASGYSQI
jgi:PAS domain S-box-containing protein